MEVAMTALPDFLPVKREPDFANLLAVLRRQAPARPTLFEFILNDRLYERLTGGEVADLDERLGPGVRRIHAFRNAGYDYTITVVPGFVFPIGEKERASTISLNEGCVIRDRQSFEAYAWPDIDAVDFAILDDLAPYLPDGMKMIVPGPAGGVEEIVIRLVGYENLCYMMVDDADLASDVFAAVGSRLVAFYQRVAPHPGVGACISNDDWGFKTGPLLSMDQMKRFLFPWHKKIAATIHAAGKPAILHSCGRFDRVADIIRDELGYDGRHSYEDAILPVEEAYEAYRDHFAILGGIDVDFMCRATPEEIFGRCRRMLDQVGDRGAYALGTGNSVPLYLPDANYFAMIRAALVE
jgi:uroporphyrinogen decarboxylase